MSKLALGTVQLGLRYGIRDRGHVKPPQVNEVVEILETAKQAEIAVLDTAFEYGVSEQVCGGHRHDYLPRMVTKTPKLRAGGFFENTRKMIKKCYEISCENLGVEQCDTLLVHDMGNLAQPGGQFIASALTELKAEGKVKHIGVSIYSAEDIDLALGMMNLDVVQVPMNIIDQRLLKDGSLAKLKDKGVEIHVRSAFLQGLLLMDPSEVPAGLEAILPSISQLQKWAAERGTSVLQLSYKYLSQLDEVDYIVCGVNTAEQLKELIQIDQAEVAYDFSDCVSDVDDVSILNPANWAKKINI